MARRKGRFLLLLASLALLLAACMADVDQTITFLADERWEASLRIAFPAEVAPLVGGTLDGEMADLQQQIESQGGAFSWERRDEDGGLLYTVDASGQGYEMLSSVAIGEMVIEPARRGEQRVINFHSFPAADMAAANSYTVTLIGGEILSSNGTETGRGQVQWQNPTGPMEAVLTERSGLGSDWLVPALIGLLIVALIGAGLFWLLRRRSATRTAAPVWSALPPDAPPPRPTPAPPPAAPAAAIKRFCTQCGAPLRPGAKFCPTCGNAQQP